VYVRASIVCICTCTRARICVVCEYGAHFAVGHDRRKLEAHALARASRHHRKCVAPVQQLHDDVFLLPAQALKAKHARERCRHTLAARLCDAIVGR